MNGDATHKGSIGQTGMLREQVIGLRRMLHMHPELSGGEEKTAALVTRRLHTLGIKATAGIGGHGVVGVLETARAGPTIAYRAEMDALPIEDSLDTAYASLHLGIKHACGHDAHIAIALGVAAQLSRMKAQLAGRVAFIFQPAEESLDGAQAMLRAGVLEMIHPDAILALHTFPLPVGTVGIALDKCLAGMEEFRVRFGTPAGVLEKVIAHACKRIVALNTASYPQDAAGFADVLEAMIRGDASLASTTVISCWSELAYQAHAAHLLGLVSIADFAQRPQLHVKIDQALADVGTRYGATYDLDYTFSNRPLSNDRDLVARAVPILEATLGTEQVFQFETLYPFAHEDFSVYAAEVPALFLWLGTQNLDKGIPSILHTHDYDIDEDALMLGVTTMTGLIKQMLAEL